MLSHLFSFHLKNGQVYSSTSDFHDTNTHTTSSIIPGSHPDPMTYAGLGHPSAGLGLHTFSPFPSAGDGSWTPTFDPNMLNSFGYTGPSIITPQNQFFFPSTDMNVWGQDPLMMNSSWLLSPVPIDQTQMVTGSGLGIDGSLASTLDPMGTIGQGFSGMSLNGSMHSLLPALGTPTLIPGNPVTGDQVDTVITPPLVPTPQDNKPKSWAAIASQPAKPRPPPSKVTQPSNTDSHDSGKKSGFPPRGNQPGVGPGRNPQNITSAMIVSGGNQTGRGPRRVVTKQSPNGSSGNSPKVSDVVSKLRSENSYNPSEMTMNLNSARFFVIKSYAEDDVHRSIKYNVWCSTEHGNRRLDSAFKEQRGKGGHVYLFFSVNGSGHFCGVAEMISEVDLGNETGIWTQDKWKGKFDIKWIYVKDVPNNQLRHIRLENNENKPVTNSRDTQEVPPEKGKLVVKVIHSFHHTTSIFDDFDHYEKRQEEDDPSPPPTPISSSSSTGSGTNSKKVCT